MRLPSSPRFKGSVESGIDGGGRGATRVFTTKKCRDVCIFGDLPIMAGLYDIGGKQGAYYEVVIRKMKGIIATGLRYTALANTVHDRYRMSSVP